MDRSASRPRPGAATIAAGYIGGAKPLRYSRTFRKTARGIGFGALRALCLQVHLEHHCHNGEHKARKQNDPELEPIPPRPPVLKRLPVECVPLREERRWWRRTLRFRCACADQFALVLLRDLRLNRCSPEP